MNSNKLLTIIFTVLSQFLFAQSKTGSISGKLKESDGKPAVGITVMIEGSNIATITDVGGYFELKNIKEGEKTLVISGVGCTTLKKQVNVFANSKTEINEIISEATHSLGEVAVEGKTESQNIRETGYNVNSLELKSIQNQNLDLNAVLGQTTGIKIREEGGLGSGFNLLLNGFSNNQVRVFIDGVPMDNFGTSLTLNNIPVNLVSRVDIYKGVVPVFLGADALGGAINVITDQHKRNFVDVSYSYGSFNTHRAAAVARVTNEKTGIVINTKGIYNYSDNNYWVDSVNKIDASKKIIGIEKVRRFHDRYHSKTAELEIGIANKKFADRLFFGCIISGNYKQYQTGANMNLVLGEVYTTDKVLIPTFKYSKSNLFTKGLDVNLYANYNIREAFVSDTSSRMYDWHGNYTYRQSGNAGEIGYNKTLFRYNDRSLSSVFNIKYQLLKDHSVSFNNTYSHYTRVGSDPISVSDIPFSKPNSLTKNVTGISYDASFFGNRLRASVFAKNYLMHATTYIDTTIANVDKILKVEKDYSFQGYGIAGSFYITPWLLAKASYESTFRIPEGFEMFGDGLTLKPNPRLRPEKSKNFNIGLITTLSKGKHRVVIEASYLYRLPEDLIRNAVNVNVSNYENVRYGRVSCVEAGVKYQFAKLLNLEVNGTYQELLNTNKYDPSGAVSELYLDKLPNIPFLFGNASAGLTFKNVFVKDSKLAFTYNAYALAGFYLKWPSQGNASTKKTIPDQISHNISLSYSFAHDGYNISLACTNLTNEVLYDNYKLQKPGRAFSVKLRYFFSKV